MLGSASLEHQEAWRSLEDHWIDAGAPSLHSRKRVGRAVRRTVQSHAVPMQLQGQVTDCPRVGGSKAGALLSEAPRSEKGLLLPLLVIWV